MKGHLIPRRSKGHLIPRCSKGPFIWPLCFSLGDLPFFPSQESVTSGGVRPLLSRIGQRVVYARTSTSEKLPPSPPLAVVREYMRKGNTQRLHRGMMCVSAAISTRPPHPTVGLQSRWELNQRASVVVHTQSYRVTGSSLR